MSVAFGILALLAAFAFALALQMRFLISHALRKALAAKFGGEANEARWRTLIAGLGRTPQTGAAADHLTATYPVPLGHLALARRVSTIAPCIVAAALIALRLTLPQGG